MVWVLCTIECWVHEVLFISTASLVLCFVFGVLDSVLILLMVSAILDEA